MENLIQSIGQEIAIDIHYDSDADGVNAPRVCITFPYVFIDRRLLHSNTH